MDVLLNENIALVWHWVRRYAALCRNRPDVDPEDLFQAGFLGMMRAAETYDPERGAWSTWASISIRAAILAALHGQTYTAYIDGKPVRKRYALQSLDAPAYADEDSDASLLETLPDESIPDFDEALLQEEDARRVREAVSDLRDPNQRTIVTEYDLRGKRQAEIAQMLGLSVPQVQRLRRSALNQLVRDKRIRQIHRERCLDRETRFLAHKGVKAFWSSRSSVVEDAVLWRESQRERTAKAPEAG